MSTLSEEIQQATNRRNSIKQNDPEHQHQLSEEQQQRQSPVKAPGHTSICNSISQAYALRREYIAAMQNPVAGMYPLPSSLSPYTWFGLLFVRSGPYQGYIIRFTLHISKGFPDSACPEVYLAPPYVFHPLVDPSSGHVDIARGFRGGGWQPHGNRLWHALHFLRRIFLRPDEFCSSTADESSNPQAAELLLNSAPDYRSEFRRRLADELSENLAAGGEPPLPDDPAADSIWRAASICGGGALDGAELETARARLFLSGSGAGASLADNKDAADGNGSPEP
uniref:UBIQUITIN_CONJUGAT_2 domain-containing protein n=1 Tax=Macrostomum lignano TaxID=282301 RepID=A0A1I8HHM9_9PLAT